LPLKINNIPSLALFSAGAIFGIILVAMALLPDMSKNTLKAQNNYGRTLASMTAKQAVDASFNHDLVRLQLILRDVVANPHLVQATIHDVENNLLVQAGEVRPHQKGYSAYTSSIVLHDSVAGYITITLKSYASKSQAASTLITLSLLFFVAIIIFSCYRSDAIDWQTADKVEKPKITTPPSEYNSSEAEDGDEASMDKPHSPSVYAVIHIKNYGVIQQQLNTETFNNTLLKLESIIADVLALYNGMEYSLQDNYYILSFNATDATNEAIFRASCSAFLIVELASIIDRVPLDLASFVSANRDELTPSKLPVAGLVLETQAAQDELIQTRLNFMEVGTEDGRMIVANFEQPYKSLLENQHKQLSTLKT